MLEKFNAQFSIPINAGWLGPSTYVFSNLSQYRSLFTGNLSEKTWMPSILHYKYFQSNTSMYTFHRQESLRRTSGSAFNITSVCHMTCYILIEPRCLNCQDAGWGSFCPKMYGLFESSSVLSLCCTLWVATLHWQINKIPCHSKISNIYLKSAYGASDEKICI